MLRHMLRAVRSPWPTWQRYRGALERGGDDVSSVRAAAEARLILRAGGWEACPGFSKDPVRPCRNTPARRLATWLAVSCMAHSQPTFPRKYVAAGYNDGCPSQSQGRGSQHLTAIPAEPATALVPQATQRRHAAAGHKLTDSATTRSLARSCPRTGLLNERGSASRAKTSVPKGRWGRSNCQTIACAHYSTGSARG